MLFLVFLFRAMRIGSGSDKRLVIEIWDQDKWSADDFMGSMSFGAEELKSIYDEHQQRGAGLPPPPRSPDGAEPAKR